MARTSGSEHTQRPHLMNSEQRCQKQYRINNNHKLKVYLVKLFLFVLLTLNSVQVIECSDKSTLENVLEELDKRDNVTGKTYFENFYNNGTFNTGNILWDNILNQCSAKPSISCLQKNVYSYLDDNLGFKGDINIANGMSFKKNNVDINKFSKEANIIYLKGSSDEIDDSDKRSANSEENEIDDEEESGKHSFNYMYIKQLL